MVVYRLWSDALLPKSVAAGFEAALVLKVMLRVLEPFDVQPFGGESPHRAVHTITNSARRSIGCMSGVDARRFNDTAHDCPRNIHATHVSCAKNDSGHPTLSNTELNIHVSWALHCHMRNLSGALTLILMGCGGTAGVMEVDDESQAVAADAGCATRAFDLNDVTFVFPLPKTDAGINQLLPMGATGDAGVLLPASMRSALPNPLSNFADPALNSTVDQARVIAARVDPCFSTPCRQQVRLIAQPVRRELDGTIRTVDATVHLFYDLNNQEFSSVVDGLTRLKKRAAGRTGCRPLGVHPVMKEEGLSGGYASELKKLILSVAGARTLTRVAVMELVQPGEAWRFSAFNVSNGALVADPVPLLNGAQRQLFQIGDTVINGHRLESISPTPLNSPLAALLNPNAVAATPNAQLQSAVDFAFTIENPKSKGPFDVDCVSCHVADRVRRRANELKGVTFTSVNKFTRLAYNLKLPAGATTPDFQRSLGYAGDLISINQRVINESAEVAVALNRR